MSRKFQKSATILSCNAARKMSLGKFSHFQTTFSTLKSFSFKILPFQEQSEIIYKVSSTSRTAVPFPVARKCRIQLSITLKKKIFKIKNPFYVEDISHKPIFPAWNVNYFLIICHGRPDWEIIKIKVLRKCYWIFILELKSCSVKGKWEMIEIRVV